MGDVWRAAFESELTFSETSQCPSEEIRYVVIDEAQMSYPSNMSDPKAQREVCQFWADVKFYVKPALKLGNYSVYDALHSMDLPTLATGVRLLCLAGYGEANVGSIATSIVFEWTVDRILSHAGSRENSVFEVRWRAGDVTWLPYEKISDLQALTAYLDLLGFDRIADLPLGDGKPPQDDPQVYLGNLTCAHPQHLSATSPSISSSLSAMSVATTEVDVCLAVYRKV